MKKAIFTTSILAISSATATPTDMVAGGTEVISLTGSFTGTAVPCAIYTVPSSPLTAVENGDSGTITGTSAPDIRVQSLDGYTPHIELTTGLAGDNSIFSGQTVADHFDVRLLAHNAATHDDASSTVLSSKVAMQATGSSALGYYEYGQKIMFQGNAVDTFDKYSPNVINMTASVTISCEQNAL